uniref:Uncharacterized protein n=1 Tax=Ascaris lumbricoides TaxID=6252 RepID=A0A0M3I8X6_ASCLU
MVRTKNRRRISLHQALELRPHIPSNRQDGSGVKICGKAGKRNHRGRDDIPFWHRPFMLIRIDHTRSLRVTRIWCRNAMTSSTNLF